MLASRRMNKYRVIHTVEIYTAMKKNEIDIYVKQKQASSRYDIVECNLCKV